MVIILYRERLEPSLPDVTVGAVVPVIAADMSRHQPLHPATQVTVFVRPQQHVKMIGHQAISDQPHRHFFVCLPHQIDEGEEVFLFVKHIIATVTTI